LDDCLYVLQPTILHLTRSSLHRCLQRHGISRLPEVTGDKPGKKKKFKAYSIGYFLSTLPKCALNRDGFICWSGLIAQASLPLWNCTRK
jgi:hypothetical protein